MWIVNLALRKPYTFVVMALLILVLGATSIANMRTDIFPEIDIPVITVLWTYKGMETNEVEARITTYSEYAITSNVNNIRKVESQTLNGVGVIKIFFHPGTNIGAAMSQVTAVSQAIRQVMPPGIQPPIIVQFNASSVPILQIALSSKTMSEAEVYDYGLYILRTQLSVVQGLTMPTPSGGRERQVMVDIDPRALQAKGVDPREVSDAINVFNLASPTGVARIASNEYPVTLNNTPTTVESFNNIPIKVVNGTTIFMRDVANVRDGANTQTTVVRKNGERGALVTLLKNGNASTLDIVGRVKEMLPMLQASAPKGLEMQLLFDQSLFVTAAVDGVVHESLIAGLLTATMILVFLGSWRSTLIIAVSIPLAILSSIFMLFAMGHSLNVMTLGGLALAVGILVDDATVEIENIHRNIGLGKPLKTAILDGAMQIAGPTFVSTLTICIVFVSVVFLDGPPRYLFVPMALAVVFAMMASYLLSRTLVPVMANYLLPVEAEMHNNPQPRQGVLAAFFAGFEAGFEQIRQAYLGVLEWALRNRKATFGVFLAAITSGALLLPHVGRDFFPAVDAGQFRLHVRAPAGSRLEQTENYFTQVESAIREIIPEEQIDLVLDNIGLPNRTYAMAFGDSSTTGQADGEILVALKKHRETSTHEHVAKLREELPQRFPELTFYFQPADIVTQILNFGLPAPIDIQIGGPSRKMNHDVATKIASRIRGIEGLVDVHLHQVVDVPRLHIEVDQTRAAQFGMTQRDVANSVLVSLSGSGQVQPNYWVDPANGISYLVESRTPSHQIDSVDSVSALPVVSNGRPVQLLSNVAQISRGVSAEVANHVNVQPVYDIYASVQGRDLGSVSAEIRKVVDEFVPNLEPGNTVAIRGQVESMESAFVRLGFGLIFAAVLVYLLMVVNFQSWLDPFIIIMALPGAFVGIVWMLTAWGTTFSVPALMGAIMSIGVATANSILMVTFANEQRGEGKSVLESALEAGRTRMRPVVMTALAMVIGMLPMSLGLGEGGEQNAPLGRAVIGGLLVATVTTLLFVPVVYSVLKRERRASETANA